MPSPLLSQQKPCVSAAGALLYIIYIIERCERSPDHDPHRQYRQHPHHRGRLRTRYPYLLRAAALRPRCHGGGIRHPAGESVTAVRGIPGADRGRHSGQCGAHAQRAGVGGFTAFMQGTHPDRGAGAEKRHQAAAGQPPRSWAQSCCAARWRRWQSAPGRWWSSRQTLPSP